MKEYKTIGILGGMGPEATAELYLRIIRIFQRRFGAKYDDDFPEIIIINLPIPDVVDSSENKEKVKNMLIKGAKKLEDAGADFISIPCNTVTYFIEDISSIKIPLINILKETAKEIERSNVKKVGLLATEMTITSCIYQNVTDKKIIILDKEKQKETTEIIIDILSGKKSGTNKARLEDFSKELIELGADKIILGCTELPLLINGDNKKIDTLQVLAEATVREAIGDNPRK